MVPKISKISQSIAPFVIIIFLLTACTPSSASTSLPPTQITDDLIATSPPEKQPLPTNAPTLDPIGLYLDSTLPSGLITEQALPGITLSDDPSSPLWLGPAEKAPEGRLLSTSSWIYTLVAPFPTLTDNVNLNDLRLYWGGHRHGPFEPITKLYVPEIVHEIIEVRWFPGNASTITTYQDIPDIEKLWEENAWAIIPFEKLDPKLKVISISSYSPLQKSFETTYYPLSFSFQLIQKQDSLETISDEMIQRLTGAIQATNRDPEKMTTLVMTGVTALVRATAYQMETKGILYPGEAIRDWLLEADLAHISNEVSFYEDCPFPNPDSRMLLFCSNPEYLELFEYVGADIIELTGNHNNDSLYVYGEDVVPYTLDIYENSGMQTYGGGRNIEEAKTPLVITHNGNRIAFIGCNAPGPDFAWATEDHGGAARCGDYQWMTAEIRNLREDGILPIATLQYYEDYYNFPESHHIEDFGLLAQSGAVIVNGSQAHRPKGMTFYNDTVIDYGLGNLFFDQMGIIDDYGNQILQTRWEKIQRHTFYDGRHLSTELLTAILEDYAQPRPMTPVERRIFLEEIFTASGWNPR